MQVVQLITKGNEMIDFDDEDFDLGSADDWKDASDYANEHGAGQD